MSKLPLSPLAPDSFPHLSDIAGIRLSVGRSGMKYKDRDDVMVLLAQEGSTVVGIFTQSATAAAPVDWSRAGIASGNPRAIITNAGNATANDIVELAQDAKEKVYAKFGITLEVEVNLVGVTL